MSADHSAGTASLGQPEHGVAEVRRVQGAGVEHHGGRHEGLPGALGRGGPLIEVGLISDLDHPIERSAPLDRCPLAIREHICEADPAMTAGVFVRNYRCVGHSFYPVTGQNQQPVDLRIHQMAVLLDNRAHRF